MSAGNAGRRLPRMRVNRVCAEDASVTFRRMMKRISSEIAL